MDEPSDFIFAFAIGMLVGVGELVGRYRDEPAQAIRTRPAYLYSTINGLASAIALVFAHTFHWTFGAAEGTPEGRLMQILVAGFGAMALFRSSLFIYRHEGADIGIGPVAFLEVMLDATDRAVDRHRAQARDKAMASIMGDLALKDVDVALLTLASNVMQNFSIEDQARLATQVKKVRDEPGLADRIKVIQIGLIVMNVVGEEVLRSIVNTIRRERDHLEPVPGTPSGVEAIVNAFRDRFAPKASGGSSAGSASGSATPPTEAPPPAVETIRDMKPGDGGAAGPSEKLPKPGPGTPEPAEGLTRAGQPAKPAGTNAAASPPPAAPSTPASAAPPTPAGPASEAPGPQPGTSSRRGPQPTVKDEDPGIG